MYDEATASIGGDVATPVKAPPSRAERIEAWKNANRSAFETAQRACCTCTPTRAQMLLVDQFEGRSNIPVD
jgi:hypothetical protein